MTTSSPHGAAAFDDVVAIIEKGDELSRDHPYVCVALAASANVMLAGGYAAWRFAPLRDQVAKMPWTPVLVVFGVDGAARHEAFRSVFDAVARATRKARRDALLCVASCTTGFEGCGDRLFARWTLTSPSWSRPMIIVLSPFATLDDARDAWRTCDINGGVVVRASNPADARRFKFLHDAATRNALRFGISVDRRPAIADADHRNLALYALVGYAGTATAAANRTTAQAETVVAEAPPMPCGAQLAPSEGVFRYVPLTRVYGAIVSTTLGFAPSRPFAVDYGGDGRFRLVSAPDPVAKPVTFVATHNSVGVHHRSVFDTICLAYPDIGADVARVGAMPLQVPVAAAAQ